MSGQRISRQELNKAINIGVVIGGLAGLVISAASSDVMPAKDMGGYLMKYTFIPGFLAVGGGMLVDTIYFLGYRRNS